MKTKTLLFLPKGTHVIELSQNGRAVKVCVKINVASAKAMQEQLTLVIAQKKRPYISYHGSSSSAKEGEVAFWIKRFFWDRNKGVMCDSIQQCKTSALTRAGRIVPCLSPTFFVNRVANDKKNPCLVVCEESASSEFGRVIDCEDLSFQPATSIKL
jgi:hypothetical protein